MFRLVVLSLIAATLPFTGPVATASPASTGKAAGRNAVQTVDTPIDRPFNAIDGRRFLEYDTRGDGRAVEVVGDLVHATHIAILVPGVDTTVANFDHGLGNVQRRAPAFQARQLYGAMTARTSEPVAVVAWLGYDPPEGVGLAAVREDRAAAGARALVSFVDTLAAAATVTIIGHSYGSVVAGLAAPRLGPNVRDIIAIGSPGMGVDTRADLHTAARVWAGTAKGDWTRWIPGVRIFGLGHGTRPAEPQFGALPLPVTGVANHDSYFVTGTGSLNAMAGIAVGAL
jgi:Alpha/beta hydrolase